MKNINCILLIDDDDDDNEYHSLIIKRAGICNSIKVVTSGDEALDYFYKCAEVNNLPDYPKPDLVYLDINMPGMNGFEFLDKYRRLDEASKSSVVIIMLSTSLNPSDKRRVMELTEVKEFQNKPLSVAELKRTIDAYYPDTTETSEGEGEPSNVEGETSKKKGTSHTYEEVSRLTAHISRLENELAQTREDIRSITEQQEAANQELQSTNEELLSASEELRSLNEELETGKEELESTNEELTVVNQELISMKEQATEARDFSEAIISNLHEPLLMLDKNLRIAFANIAFYKTFQVNEAETEGQLIYDLGSKQWNIPALRTLLEEILPNHSKFDKYEVSHRFETLGERIMLLNAREIFRVKGEEKFILLAIEDVTESVSGQKKIVESEERFRNLVMQAPIAMGVFRGENCVIETVNNKMTELWGRTNDQVINKPVFDALPEYRNVGFEEILENLFKTGERYLAQELPVTLHRNGKASEHYFTFLYEPLRDANGTVTGIMSVAHEVTEQFLARKKVEESEYRYKDMVYSSPSMIAILKGEDMVIEIVNDAMLETWGKEKDVLGKSLLTVMPELIEQGFDKLLHGVYTTGQPSYGYEMPVQVMRNGESQLSYYTFVYQAQRKVNGEIEGVAILANEVTPQVQAKKLLIGSEEQFSALAENMENLAWTADGQGAIYWYNRRWYNYTGTTPEEMKGWGWVKVHHPDHLKRVVEFVKQAWQKNEPWELTFPLRGADGAYKWFLTRAATHLNFRNRKSYRTLQ